MAFARLFFPHSIECTKKLKEIVRFCCGQILSVENLEFANKYTSQIILGTPCGWNLSNNIAFENNLIATKSEYYLESKCVDDLKTKYCKIFATAPITTISSNTLLQNIDSSAISADAWITTKNESFYPKNLIPFTSATNIKISAKIDLTASDFYISCSSKHIFILSASDTNSFASVIEFPETNYSRSHNNVPMMIFNSSNLSSSNSGAIIDLNSNSIQSTSLTVTIDNYKYLPEWVSQSNFQRQNAHVSPINTFSNDINNKLNLKYGEFTLTPLIEFRQIYGESIHYYSAYSNIFLIESCETANITGQEISLKGYNYILLDVGTIGNYRTLAIEKK